MKLAVATLSLLVLLALSGSILALVSRQTGLLLKEFSRKEFSAEANDAITEHQKAEDLSFPTPVPETVMEEKAEGKSQDCLV